MLKDVAIARSGRTLVSGLSYRLAAGSSLLLKGPNGSGKTSLLRAIAGLLAPQAGSIVLEQAGTDRQTGEHAHFIGHGSAVKGNLTIQENFKFWQEFLNGDHNLTDTMAQFGLTGLEDIPAHFLSEGQKRKLALARLMAAPRPVWLLDEPSVSLDEAARQSLVELMRGHVKGGGIVIASSHVNLGLKFDQTLKLGAKL